MTTRGLKVKAVAPADIGDSDYGSDFDDDTWDTVFAQLESQPLHEIAITSIEEPVIPPNASQTRTLRVARIRAHFQAGHDELDGLLADLARGSRATADLPTVQTIEYESESAAAVQGIRYNEADAAFTADKVIETTGLPTGNPLNVPENPETVAGTDEGGLRSERSPSVPPELDTRSPLQRFRTRPKKPLSVTDIISPAWCELQYWFSLTKFGRVRKTPAMKQGSKIHKEKELEVHTEVPVETVSSEDRFGLRLWNIITGLRTLRTTGLTRELEVLGLVDGEVIVGVIDEISRQHPNAAGLEAGASSKPRRRKSKSKDAEPPPDQPRLTEFFASPRKDNDASSQEKTAAPPLSATDATEETLYVVDIKTRRSKTLPGRDQMRPTRMQLMMYRRLLMDLAADRVNADTIFDRYRLNPSIVFTDTFLSALSGIQLNIDDISSDGDGRSSKDNMAEALQHNNLKDLWGLMISEFAKTIPDSSLSPLLTAEYRSSDNGEVIGKRSFDYDAAELESYVDSEMRWWRGDRGARGVEIEEAYKCRICEFAESCHWRNEKMEQAISAARAKRSTVE